MKIGVRDASDADLRFMRKLALDSALHGIPYGRKVSNSAVKARIRESIARIVPDRDTIILIAYLEETSKPIGYLILELGELEGSTGEPQSMIYDLGVHPKYWGTPAVRHLVNEAARRTAKAGLDYMVGEVSAHNERTYLQALRLGFELERFQIVMACNEEGPAPMPGRPDSEKHYLQSRKSKKSRIRVPGTWDEARQQRKDRS